MSTAPELPELLTAGEARTESGASFSTIHTWCKQHPELVAYVTPVGRLLYRDRWDAFLAKRSQVPRKPRPRSAAVGSVEHASD